MSQIDFIIIGAQKAGTTSLHNYLKSHPELVGHNSVEFAFFADEKEYKKGFKIAYNQYYNTIQASKAKKIIAKNVTISFREEALSRLKLHNPNVKLVLLLREPVSRAYSAYTMAVKNGWMKREFSEVTHILTHKKYEDIMYRHFIAHGLYSKQIKTVLEYFSPKHLKIFLFEDLISHPDKVCKSLFKWLEVDTSFQPDYKKIYNPTTMARSEKMTKIIGSLRSNDNIAKALAKKILPYSIFRTLGSTIVNINRSKKHFAGIDRKSQDRLSAFYLPHNKELLALISSKKIEDCFCIYSETNWLNK